MGTAVKTLEVSTKLANPRKELGYIILMHGFKETVEFLTEKLGDSRTAMAEVEKPI